MLKRLLKYNRFFSVLFLLSFFVSFIIMYYGLDLNRQLVQVSEVREGAVYRYGHEVRGSFAEDVGNSNDIKEGMTSGGNIIFRCDGPVGEGVINTDAIDVLWAQNEELSEPVKYEEYYLNGNADAISVPKCIIGDAWEGETYVRNGIRYIKIFQIESCVIGEYVSNNFTGEDERCLVFKDSLSQEDLDKIVFDTGGIRVIYESNRSDETELFTEWVHTFFTEENFQESEIETDVWASSGGHKFSLFMSMYQKEYLGMLILCFINCAFLAYFWGDMHIYEYMLKRTLGYGKLRLLADIIFQFALYEAAALGAALLLTCGYELLCKDIVVWYENIRLGFLQMVLIFVLFGVLLSAFPMIPVMKLKPAGVLKNID